MRGVVQIRHLPSISKEFGFRIGARVLWKWFFAILRGKEITFLGVLKEVL
jgi:hypothetical protein